MSGTPVHSSWIGMRERCTNPKIARAKSYTGKGIAICSRWQKFENFYADMGDRPEGMSLERLDRNKNYMPSNCVWASPRDQAINRDSTRLITAKGKTMHLTDWARKLNIQPSAIRWRIENGWSEEMAVTTKARADSRRLLRTKPIGSW